LGPRKVEQTFHDPAATLHLGVDDLQVLVVALTIAGGQVPRAERQRLGAGQDRRLRVVDLVHDTRRELPHGGELLRFREALLRLAPLGDVFTDGDDVRNVVPVLPHRDLGDAVVTRFAARLRLHFHLLELAGVEHAIELALQEIAWLAVEHVEDLATHGVLARHALGPGLALAVPRADAIAPVDHVQPDRERVDDLGGKAPLRLHLVRAQRDLGGEVLRQLRGGEDGSEDAGHDDDYVMGDSFVASRGNDDLEQAERLVLVDQRQPHDRAPGHPLALRAAPHPLGHRRGITRLLRFVTGGGDRREASAVRCAEPEAAAAEVEAAPQRAHHAVQGLSGGEARLQHRRHLGNDPDTGMLGIEGGNRHRWQARDDPPVAPAALRTGRRGTAGHPSPCPGTPWDRTTARGSTLWDPRTASRGAARWRPTATPRGAASATPRIPSLRA